MRSHRRRLSPQSGRKPSSQSNELGVSLVRALEAQEVVVAAVLALGVGAADAGTRFVDGAAALLLVEERAHGGEHRVLLVPSQARLFFRVVFSEALLGLAVAELETLSTPLDAAR